jgi:NADH-quinone oxidoreductase subunit J
MPSELGGFFSASVLFFGLFALGAIVTAILTVLSGNPVRSALFLVMNLFCVAGLYLLLNAYFLAAVQVIVYAGAIMVLFLFVIMLLNLGSPDRTPDDLKWQQPVAVLIGLVLAGVLGWTICASIPAGSTLPQTVTTVSATGVSTVESADSIGTVQGVGGALYRGDLPYLFPFEATSILLLIAVIGSVVLAQHRAPTARVEGEA